MVGCSIAFLVYNNVKNKGFINANNIFTMKKSLSKELFKVFKESRLTTVAGAWVYYFLTSLIPLVFLLVSAFSVFGVSLTKDFISRLPMEFREAGVAIASTAENASKSATAVFV